MRILLSIVFLLLITGNCLPQIPKEYLIGGNFSGTITQADHLQWGKSLDLMSNINCEVLTSFTPPIISSYKSKHFDDVKRFNRYFNGACISFVGYWSNTDTVNMRYIAIGPYLALKYYTPINLFLKFSIGIEFERSRIWEPSPSQNSLYIPKAHSFGFGYEFFIGYSFQLPGKVLFEPNVSYKILRSDTYFPGSDEKLFLPKNSFNFHLGFLFIINKQML